MKLRQNWMLIVAGVFAAATVAILVLGSGDGRDVDAGPGDTVATPIATSSPRLGSESSAGTAVASDWVLEFPEATLETSELIAVPNTNFAVRVAHASDEMSGEVLDEIPFDLVNLELGERVWVASLGDGFSATVLDATTEYLAFLVQGLDNDIEVVFVKTSDGSEVLRHPVDSQAVHAVAALDGSEATVGDGIGNISRLSLASGGLIWDLEAPSPSQQGAIEFGSPIRRIFRAGDRIFFWADSPNSQNNRLSAIRLQGDDPSIVWSVEPGSNQGVESSDPWALESEHRVWQILDPNSGHHCYSDRCAEAEVLCASGGFDGGWPGDDARSWLKCFEPDTGSTIWSLEGIGLGIVSAGDGRLYITTNDESEGRLISGLNIDTSAVEWRRPLSAVESVLGGPPKFAEVRGYLGTINPSDVTSEIYVVDGGTSYVPGGTNVTAISLVDGEADWSASVSTDEASALWPRYRLDSAIVFDVEGVEGLWYETIMADLGTGVAGQIPAGSRLFGTGDHLAMISYYFAIEADVIPFQSDSDLSRALPIFSLEVHRQ